jgi:lactate dehydrogenase-like 2-hydroxyacid dehydrogenase
MPVSIAAPLIFSLDPLQPEAESLARRHFELVTSDSPRIHAWRDEAEGLLVRGSAINREDLARTKRLKFIAKHGVGVDKIDVQAARAMGIVVMNTPGVNVSAHMLAHRSRKGKLIQTR